MVARIKKRNAADGTFYAWEFTCPGCGRPHAMKVGPGGWEFNGDVERPTFKPSILSTFKQWQDVEGTNELVVVNVRCHSYVTDGHIMFLRDSTHKFAGQTLDLPAIDAD